MKTKKDNIKEDTKINKTYKVNFDNILRKIIKK